MRKDQSRNELPKSGHPTRRENKGPDPSICDHEPRMIFSTNNFRHFSTFGGPGLPAWTVNFCFKCFKVFHSVSRPGRGATDIVGFGIKLAHFASQPPIGPDADPIP